MLAADGRRRRLDDDDQGAGCSPPRRGCPAGRADRRDRQLPRPLDDRAGVAPRPTASRSWPSTPTPATTAARRRSPASPPRRPTDRAAFEANLDRGRRRRPGAPRRARSPTPPTARSPTRSTCSTSTAPTATARPGPTSATGARRVGDGGTLLIHDSFSSIGVTLAIVRELVPAGGSATSGARARWPSTAPTSRPRRPGGATPPASSPSCRGSPATSPSRCCSTLGLGTAAAPPRPPPPGVAVLSSRIGRTGTIVPAHRPEPPVGSPDCGDRPTLTAHRLGPHGTVVGEVVERSARDVERAASRRSRTCPARGGIARGLGRSYGDPAQNGGGTRAAPAGPRPRGGLDAAAGDGHGAGRGQPRRAAARDRAPRLLRAGHAGHPLRHGRRGDRQRHPRQEPPRRRLVRHQRARGCRCCSPTARSSRLGPTERPELFWATVGGMGLTGVILDATIRLLPIETSRCAVDTERAPDLDALLALMDGGRPVLPLLGGVDRPDGHGPAPRPQRAHPRRPRHGRPARRRGWPSTRSPTRPAQRLAVPPLVPGAGRHQPR